ncbi:hypothetical protein CROQUDRAFT_51694 [Cronartium quercuum f. sp. fusiforme G11]|uniref:Selenoprotein O n=1 Tax=Cronartium quercuum f. sp. fusiforme G11 TaxID=708437 RepID=A0A9P6N7Q4_9BASI|nr:hypothetical protein CROQUDRAFT_51694 [Cronartium quercuum f. sp. fusiforme G11]
MPGSTRSSTSILGLPLALSPIHFLQPDLLLPSTSVLFELSKTNSKPSILRRSRPVKGAFSFVTPLPKAFPYAIKPPQDDQLTMDHIEAFLSSLEPDLDHPIHQPHLTCPDNGITATGGLTSSARSAHYKALRPTLLQISQRAAKDCLPNLDIGTEASSSARTELIQVLTGELVIGRLPGSDDNSTENPDDQLIRSKGFGPWSLAYAGHQFGHFAGQLGDGRAISIPFNLPSDTNTKPVIEIQLKGAGRTPFSRFADGLALLRSSIREHLASEFVSSLEGFPTSRSLAIISLPGLEVERERVSGAGIVARLSPSWIRIGSFELCRSREDWDGLENLLEFVGYQLFGFERSNKEGEEVLGVKVVKEVMMRNAKMVAAWQAWGFMHGVINTDNLSVLGLTIDYGPYAFMDIFDPDHVCNHSDDSGRYSYSRQPSMVKFGLEKLADSVAELVGFQLVKLSSPFSTAITDENRETWKKAGREALKEILSDYEHIYESHYLSLMRKRLGLTTADPNDLKEIVEPLLDLMADRSDYSNTIRNLSQLHSPSFLNIISTPTFSSLGTSKDWTNWINKYKTRIELEGEDKEKWEINMKSFNPEFILRQWVLEEIISNVNLLNDVMNLINNQNNQSSGNDKEDWLCGIGPKALIGFQCSCSS